MSASTEPTSPRGVLGAAWRPAGVIYLACLLAGLAAGLWPDAIYPARAELRPAPLPTLKALAVAQVAFILLGYPLVLFGRRRREWPARFWAAVLVESAGLLVAAVPFYLVAAYLADATAIDTVRTAIYAAALMPLAWSAGAWMARSPRWRPWVAVDMITITLALPAAYYIAREFLTPDPMDWLWHLAPATFAWQTASSRAPSLLARPLWALTIWPLAAAAGVCSLWLRPRTASPDEPAAD